MFYNLPSPRHNEAGNFSLHAFRIRFFTNAIKSREVWNTNQKHLSVSEATIFLEQFIYEYVCVSDKCYCIKSLRIRFTSHQNISCSFHESLIWYFYLSLLLFNAFVRKLKAIILYCHFFLYFFVSQVILLREKRLRFIDKRAFSAQ